MQGFGEIAEKLRRSTVHLRIGAGTGSGVIWNADGLIVTNAHVARADRAVVELWDGRHFTAALEERDTRRDLASLRIENAGGLAAATPGDSSALRPGELVIAVGNPLGFTGALSTGVVHALGPLRGVSARTWVQADVRLLPGNSGGPLADARGRVIGINTMIAGRLALAVPSNTVAEFLRRGASGVQLGVVIQPVPVDFEGGRLGLLVLKIVPGSAAAAASLLPGDLLLGLAGRAFRAPDDLAEALEASGGGVLALDFLRGDRSTVRHVTVRLEPARAAVAA
ncbi:MAG: S1C family serine protease [Acidobacteriota bacterium]